MPARGGAIVTVTVRQSVITVTRGDAPKVRGGSWGTAESSFWKRLQTVLNANSHGTLRWIKTCPAKDGHLTGAPFYLTNAKRTRFVHDGQYAIRCPAEDYNAGRAVVLEYHTA